MRGWRFQPPLWAACSACAGVIAFCAMGIWQIHRGQAKQVLLDQFAHTAAAPARKFDLSRVASGEIQHVEVSGRYEAMHQLLLDNQTYQQRPGYRVLTPLRLENGALILVNRGWLPQTRSREQLPQLPVTDDVQTFSGYWAPLPRPGLKQEQQPCGKAAQFPLILNFPDAAQIGCVLGEPVADGQLLLDNGAANGFVREWTFDNGFPPSRHYGYALQWFALAATLAIIFFKLNIKRVRDPNHE